MTRKKTLTGLLFALCAVIWGTIAWKVYSTMHEGEGVEPRPLVKSKPQREKSITLLLNYRDPFLGGYPQDKPVVTNVKNKQINPNAQPVSSSKPIIEEMPPNFQYKGIMRIGKEIKAIVAFNGQIQMIKSKEKLGDFSIMTIKEKSITVSRKHKNYTIPLS